MIKNEHMNNKTRNLINLKKSMTKRLRNWLKNLMLLNYERKTC